MIHGQLKRRCMGGPLRAFANQTRPMPLHFSGARISTPAQPMPRINLLTAAWESSRETPRRSQYEMK